VPFGELLAAGTAVGLTEECILAGRDDAMSTCLRNHSAPWQVCQRWSSRPTFKRVPSAYSTAHTDGTRPQILLDRRRCIKAGADSADRSRFAEQALQPTIKETIMAITPNKDQVKGELKDLGGKIQEEAGKLVGSEEQQRSGLKKQTEGKLQKAVGDVKEVVTDAVSKA